MSNYTTIMGISSQTDYTEANHPRIDLNMCMHVSVYGMYVVCMYVCVSERREIKRERVFILYQRCYLYFCSILI